MKPIRKSNPLVIPHYLQLVVNNSRKQVENYVRSCTPWYLLEE